jgi:signal transduction histidine kinase
MARALHEAQEYNGEEIIIERPDGSRWFASAYANPLYDDGGRVAGAVNVLVDITARKHAEEELRRADRCKSEFLAMLAHELRNPLAPLRNGLYIMRVAGDNRAAAAEARAMMERQVGQMTRLIDDLVDLSRITNGKIALRKERIDLAAAVQDAVETSRPLVEAAGHYLTVTLPPVPVLVYGDRTRLAQVFSNLLNNSAKYTEQGGRIWLTVERQGRDVVVQVKDTGVGIAPDLLPRVFDMFTQAEQSLDRSQGGLGIGLSLVRRLVEMHGGTVEASSDGPGKGSEFAVRLPAVLSANEIPQRGSGADAHGLPNFRILIVDDCRDSAQGLAMLLKLTGHTPRTAHDGLEGVEAAKEFRPHVVLLDVGLPKLNGYEVCRSLRAHPWSQGMTIVALTGWGEEDRRPSGEAGFDYHLVKPLNVAELEKLLAGLARTTV